MQLRRRAMQTRTYFPSMWNRILILCNKNGWTNGDLLVHTLPRVWFVLNCLLMEEDNELTAHRSKLAHGQWKKKLFGMWEATNLIFAILIFRCTLHNEMSTRSKGICAIVQRARRLHFLPSMSSFSHVRSANAYCEMSSQDEQSVGARRWDHY